jgi:hypothetical protein
MPWRVRVFRKGSVGSALERVAVERYRVDSQLQ